MSRILYTIRDKFSIGSAILYKVFPLNTFIIRPPSKIFRDIHTKHSIIGLVFYILFGTIFSAQERWLANYILNVKNGPDCSEPLISDCFDFLEIGHRVRMSTEVELQALHIIQLSLQPKALNKCSVFLCGQVDFSFLLHHIHNARKLFFQLRNLLLNLCVFLVVFPQVRHNIAIDLREGILQAGGQIEICVTHGFHSCFCFTIPIGEGNIKCAISNFIIVVFAILCVRIQSIEIYDRVRANL